MDIYKNTHVSISAKSIFYTGTTDATIEMEVTYLSPHPGKVEDFDILTAGITTAVNRETVDIMDLLNSQAMIWDKLWGIVHNQLVECTMNMEAPHA